MTSLLESERRFAECLLGLDPHGAQRLVASDRFTGAQRLAVYRNNVRASLRGALGAIYPVVARLVGEGFFGFLAAEYARAYPSRSANLHDFGAELAPFLDAFEPARALAYLGDVARLEWAWHEAFHAADASPLPPAQLEAALAGDIGALRCRLHPACRTVASRWPILRIWRANQDEVPAVVDLEAGAERVLVARPALEVELRSIAPGELALLEGLAAGRRVLEACEAALALEPALALVPLLEGHLARGTIVGLYC